MVKSYTIDKEAGAVTEHDTHWREEQHVDQYKAVDELAQMSQDMGLYDEGLQTRDSGFMKADKFKCRYEMVDPNGHEALAWAKTIGAAKYDDFNYLRATKKELLAYVGAAERHLKQVQRFLMSDDEQELYDPETGLMHTAGVLASAEMLTGCLAKMGHVVAKQEVLKAYLKELTDKKKARRL